MATFTADAAQSTVPAREVADGVTVTVGQLTLTAVPSIGDIYQMIRLPPNVMLLGLQVAGSSPGAAAGYSMKCGYTGQSGTASIFSAAVSVSAVQNLAQVVLNLPRQLTVSDDTTVQSSLLTMKVAAVGSATSATTLVMIATYARKGCGVV